jgi:orotate phosphoribosyltransferase
MPSVSELEKLLREHGAVREGHFVLASGNHSEHYVQTAQLMQEPKLVDEILEDVSRKLERTFGDVDRLLTAATGGITFAQQVGLKLNKTTIFAERDETNTLEFNRGFEIFEGDSVLLVEDVVTTGGTLEELEDLVEEYGATVAGVFSMINRSGMDDWNDRPFLSLLTVDYPVYSPEDCPGCTEGDEAVRPGTKSVDGESD